MTKKSEWKRVGDGAADLDDGSMESSPVFDLQSRHSHELHCVACDQGGPQAQRLGGNEGVQRANHLA